MGLYLGVAMEQVRIETLLRFFKALANENRLKILGILADRECGVEELATLLNVRAPTISHHLAKLKALSLVDMRTDGNDHLHRLNVDGLREMNRRFFSAFESDQIDTLVDGVAHDAWERKVLSRFLEDDQIRAIPAGYKKRLVILKWLISHFEMDVRYTEKEVNEIIGRHHADYCTLRREFIINGLMEREAGVYWRVEWQMPDLM
jgi:hypothetical protein